MADSGFKLNHSLPLFQEKYNHITKIKNYKKKKTKETKKPKLVTKRLVLTKILRKKIKKQS